MIWPSERMEVQGADHAETRGKLDVARYIFFRTWKMEWHYGYYMIRDDIHGTAGYTYMRSVVLNHGAWRSYRSVYVDRPYPPRLIERLRVDREFYGLVRECLRDWWQARKRLIAVTRYRGD